MDDLVTRIRSRPNDAPMPTERLLDEAADEIERLRRVNGEIRTIFRANMLRAYPTMSHADIDAAMTTVPD